MRVWMVASLCVSLLACDGAQVMAPADVQGSPYVVYGSDDRQEWYEVSDPATLAIADATAVVVSEGGLTSYSNGDVGLDDSLTLQDYASVCTSEPYWDQPAPGECTAFLVGSDLMATAGHCIDDTSCGDTSFVFGFRLDGPGDVRTRFPESDVYACAEVVTRSNLGSLDYALVRLERPVVGHAPLDIRRTGDVSVGTPVVATSHPMGLPMKVSGNATVRSSSANNFFEANLDTYEGSSGAPVVNAFTLRVEGIVVDGNPDFVWNGICSESNVCPDSGCPWWEVVTRISLLEPFIPPIAAPSASVCEEDGFEENDSLAAAVELGPGSYSDLGLCEEAGDWFAFELTAGSTLRVEIEFEHAEGDLDLELFDGPGLVDWSDSVSDGEIVEYTALTDTIVYLHVFGFLGDDNAYDLTAEVDSAPTAASVPLQLTGDPFAVGGWRYSWFFEDATPGERVVLLTGTPSGSTPVPGCYGVSVPGSALRVVAVSTADGQGDGSFSRVLPTSTSGSTKFFWAVSRAGCMVSSPQILDIL